MRSKYSKTIQSPQFCYKIYVSKVHFGTCAYSPWSYLHPSPVIVPGESNLQMFRLLIFPLPFLRLHPATPTTSSPSPSIIVLLFSGLS